VDVRHSLRRYLHGDRIGGNAVSAGDSLIFAAGALAGAGALDVHRLIPLLIVAALTGDNLNYFIGRTLGPRVFRERSRF
jgi:membrane-associated protein